MEIYLIIGIIAAVAMAALAYIAGSSGKKKLEADVARLEGNVAEQNRKLAAQEARMRNVLLPRGMRLHSGCWTSRHAAENRWLSSRQPCSSRPKR